MPRNAGGRVAQNFRTSFGAAIAEHWEANYPEFWSGLGSRAAALADECADKACEFFATALVRGEKADTAYRFAEIAWVIPPDRKPPQSERPHGRSQKVSTTR